MLHLPPELSQRSIARSHEAELLQGQIGGGDGGVMVVVVVVVAVVVVVVVMVAA